MHRAPLLLQRGSGEFGSGFVDLAREHLPQRSGADVREVQQQQECRCTYEG